MFADKWLESFVHSHFNFPDVQEIVLYLRCQQGLRPCRAYPFDSLTDIYENSKLSSVVLLISSSCGVPKINVR